MNNQENLIKNFDSLSNTLKLTVTNWRLGNDHNGHKYFINTIEQLEAIINIYLQNEKKFKLKELLPILNALNKLLINRDVIGITDLLEFSLVPYIEALRKEVSTNAN